MPLQWTIDSQQKLVTVVAQGDITRADFDTLLDVLRDAGTNHYRRLFDGKAGHTRMTAEDVLALGVRMRSVHESGPMGPLAAVVPDEYADLIAGVLGMLAAADRPMRVFRNVAEARKWIEGLAEPAGS